MSEFPSKEESTAMSAITHDTGDVLNDDSHGDQTNDELGHVLHNAYATSGEETTTIVPYQQNDDSHEDQTNDESDRALAAHYGFWSKYKGVFFSMFIFKFLELCATRSLAFYDVITDFLQLKDHWERTEKFYCTATIIRYNHTNASSTTSPTLFILDDPGWFVITLLSIYLPPVVTLLRMSGKEFRKEFFRCPFYAYEYEENSTSQCGERCQRVCCQIPGFLLKLIVLPFLPVLLPFRQFRQIAVTVELQRISNEIDQRIDKRQCCDKIIKTFLKNARICCCCFGWKKRKDEKMKKGVTDAVREALSDESYTAPPRTKLNDILTRLSIDRHDEALLETTPQALLNLMIIFRLGCNHEG